MIGPGRLIATLRRVLAKDLRLLRRAPVLVAVLVGYPVLVALLVAAALRGGEHEPTVALVNEDQSGRVVILGDRRLSVDDYVDRLAADVTVRRLDAARAASALEDGRVSAVVTIPEGFMSGLQSGLRPPVLGLETSRRSPIEADQVERQLRSALFDVNQELSATYVDYVSQLFAAIGEGGELCLFGRCGRIIGLGEAERTLSGLNTALTARGLASVGAELPTLIDFVRGTRQNLALAGPAAQAIKSPIRLEVTRARGGREPISAFGLAGALLVSVALVGVLLAAALLSAEREEHTLARLRRGLVHPGSLIAAKAIVGAMAAAVVGMVLLGAVALLTDLAVGRWATWLGILTLAGLTFGAFGALVGALARETRTALLAGLMVALPLLFVGLIPGGGAAHAVARLTPFAPAFDAFQALLVEPAPGHRVWVDAAQLAAVAAALGALAAVALARRGGDAS